MPYAAASGAALGSWTLVGVPLAVAVVLAAACLWRPSPLLVLVVFAAFAGFFASKALDGLADPPVGPVAGWVTLLDDPRPLGPHGIRITVRYGDDRLEARAYGAAAARLDDALAGERVLISGTARPAVGDWHRWRHVAATLNVDAVADRAGAAPLGAFTNRLRRLLETGAGSLPDDSRAMFSGMVYGDDRSQSPRLYDDFRAAGLGHLLVVSGQNVAFVLALASPLTIRARPGVRMVMLLVLLAVFAVLTRFEPSVLRAVTMAGVAVTSAALGRPETGRRTLAWAVAAVLVADPFLIRVLAFQLSVCATCGLLWIAPTLTEMLPGPRPLRLAAATTAGAQLAVMPLLVAVFGAVPLASLPANVIAGPATAPVMMWGLTGGLGAGLAGEPVAWLIHRPTAVLLWWVRNVAAAAAAAPPAMLGVGGAAMVGTGAVVMLVSRRLRQDMPLGGGVGVSSGVGPLGGGVGVSSGVGPLGGGVGVSSGVGPLGGGVGVSSGVGPLGGGVGVLSGVGPLGGGVGVLGRNRAVSALGGVAVAAAMAVSLVTAASPPPGWSKAGGTGMFHHPSAVVVVLEESQRPRDLLESLRLAGVRRVDLVVASRGGASDAYAVLALKDRHRRAAVVAPPMHRVPHARTVRAGDTVLVGALAVAVVADAPLAVAVSPRNP